MTGHVEDFYSDLAEHYHLIFEDWERSIERQADILGPLVEERIGPAPLRVLDCSCGIGTQALGLARRGHRLTATDISEAAIKRAEREARKRELDIRFHVNDMRNLSLAPQTAFDVVLAADNSLPHLLSDTDLHDALQSMAACLRPGGLFLASIRDYDKLLRTRPDIQPPAFYTSEDGQRRIVHQLWDWKENEYELHLYLTWSKEGQWVSKHYATRYRAIKRAEMEKHLDSAGLRRIQWLMPEETSFYQPIVLAVK
ncbi:class I SAM-dependent methyltransferase [Silvibacterium acidisoli]|uniref:class I SAM-dependent methyltransferase n=1 Tax=Acidobacteriaceae bacterium ZG23-2 TaxID=2883246 RepID=UPI00406D03D2